MSKDSFIDFADIDYDNVLVSREEICKVNPHRFEMMLLDGILHLDEDVAVGYLDLKDDAFWIRGHFPDRPIMPGVLMCESAAQLSCYFALSNHMVDEGYVGLGGLESIRFRGQVVPGNRLTVMLRKGRVRRNVMFTADFQGYVDETLVIDGVIKGVALG